MYTYENHPSVTARTHELAYRFANPDGSLFVMLNLDHFGGFFEGGFLARRLRRMIDRAVTRDGVPVFPVPYLAWGRVWRQGAVFRIVERRRRECVFTRDQEYYLSGFDTNETPALYFLTQLPRPVASIKEAREALKPQSVIMAERAGRVVYRQGDMFAIPTLLTTGDIEAMGGTIIAGQDHKNPACRLYGTAHTADRVASLPDGTMLAYGWLHHDPGLIREYREPDHKALRLKSNRWHVVAKNTTPMVTDTP
jgi:hypothetical protein